MSKEELVRLMHALQTILDKLGEIVNIGFDEGVYVGTREDWIHRAQAAENKLSKIEDILNATTPSPCR